MGIVLVLGLIILCLAPSLRDIIIVFSVCTNALSMAKGLMKVSKNKKKKKKKKSSDSDSEDEKEGFCNIPNPYRNDPNGDLSRYNKLQYAMVPRPYTNPPLNPHLSNPTEAGKQPFPFEDASQTRFVNYPGRVDFDTDANYGPGVIPGNENPLQDGNDRMARMNIARQGTDAVRQISGAMNRQRMMAPWVTNECAADEVRDWWGNYDVA